MMKSLPLLIAALHDALSGAVHDFAVDMRPLERETAELIKWMGERGADRPAQDAITAAVVAFYTSSQFASFRQTRLVAFGCLARVLPRNQILIEDSERFPRVLNGVDAYSDQPRAFRLCYRGLLYAYFGYNFEQAPEVGRDNWQALRAYLRARAENTRTAGTLPAWVDRLQSNRDLLENDPVRIYAAELLNDEPERFQAACKDLDIHDSSWLIWHIVLGQIKAAAESSDSTFKSQLSRLVDLLARHPLAADRGLALLLKRYRDCASHEVHAELRDLAVAQWGNPWLKRNDAKWSLVQGDARSMVTTWLKLVLIQQFFSLLAEDGRQDPRRLKFWEKYHEHIDDMYFALGPTASHSRDKDFQDIRKKMDGRRLRLVRGGSTDNNAFIMFIGRYVVVEFGVANNACFIFASDALPFTLEGEVDGDKSGLKHPSGERLLHKDRGGFTWEELFQSELASRLAVRPTGSGVGLGARSETSYRLPSGPTARPSPEPWRSSVAPPASGPQQFRPIAPITPEPSREGFSLRQLSSLCSPRGIRVQDLRDQNGNLWVRTDDADQALCRQLEAWGFAYKPEKGWWHK